MTVKIGGASPTDVWAKQAKVAKRDALELAMAQQIHALRLDGWGYCTQHRFSARKWTFDFAWLDKAVALEVEGGIWVQGRHSRGAGYEADAIKYNSATLLGWRVFRVTGGMVKDGRAIELLEEVFRGLGS
jgi:hypothetical protein